MKTQIIKDLEAHIARECKAINREERFDEMLNSEGEVNVAGLTFMPSQIWREMDPTAHRCGVNDYANGEDWVEVAGEYYERDEAREALEAFTAEIQDAVNTLESDIEDMDEEEDADQLKEMQTELSELQAKLAEAEAYSL